MRDHAHTLSDFRVPTLSIECEPCGRFGRYTIARLMEKYGDARLTELLYILAYCPKARVQHPRPLQGGLRQRQPFLFAVLEPQAVLSARGDRHSLPLQTGTGTAHTTAINTAAITAVIFSLVDRSMASSGKRCQLLAVAYARPLVFTL